MHRYFVEIYKYKENGSLESRPIMTQTCDNELQLRKIRDQYAYEMQTDAEGNSTSMKAFKVIAHKLTYVKIDDIDAEINRIFS